MIEVGDKAPAFELADQDGRTHKLSDYRGKWVVLYFYPKDNTPGCTSQACQFRDTWDDLAARGAVVLGVSPDNVKSHRRFADRHGLPFPLLADVDHAVCEAYGVWGQKSMFGRKYMGVLRTTYVIDPTGKVSARLERVKVPAHAAKIASLLDERR